MTLNAAIESARAGGIITSINEVFQATNEGATGTTIIATKANKVVNVLNYI